MEKNLFELIVEHFPYPILVLRNDKEIIFKNVPINEKTVQKLNDYETKRVIFLENHTKYEMIIIEGEKSETIIEQTQKQWARILHDDIAQSLFSLFLYVQSCKKKQKNASGIDFEVMENIIEEMLEKVRGLSREIRNETANHSFAQQLEEEIKKWNDWSSFHVMWKKHATGEEIQPIMTADVIFIIKEAVMNAMRHSNGETIMIHTYKTDGRFYFVIQDDGEGFQVTKTKSGLGSYHMKERAEKWGGSVGIQSMEKQGTVVTGWIPL